MSVRHSPAALGPVPPGAVHRVREGVLMPGERKHGFTFGVSDEMVIRMPTEALQVEVARHFGDLLTAAILDPESDPFGGPIRIQSHQEYVPYLRTHQISGRLFCKSAERDVVRPDYRDVAERDIHLAMRPKEVEQ